MFLVQKKYMYYPNNTSKVHLIIFQTFSRMFSFLINNRTFFEKKIKKKYDDIQK